VGVPHVVFSSVGGAERESGVPHFDSKRRVEERLEQIPLQLVAVRDIGLISASFLLDGGGARWGDRDRR
jgi:uncharacterized protein YbjT (DUF2867 family)